MFRKRMFKGRRPVGRKVGMKGAAKVYAPKKAINVSRLESKVNGLIKQQRKETEMKSQELSTALASSLGQVNVNGSGVFCQDITGCMSIGSAAGGDNRVGLKCNLKGIFLRYQVQQQSALAIGVKYILEVWKTQDVNTVVGSFPGLVFNVDSISGVIDYNSSRNMLYRKNYQRVYAKSFYIPADSVSGVSGFIDKKVLIKQRQLLEWPTTATSNPQNIRYLVTIRASAGNLNTTTVSTLPNIPLTAANTGAVGILMATSYYTD